jgi:hypothetical protein
MKAGALALALAISAVQTVGWVNCCCVLICQHQDKVCKDCQEKKSDAAAPKEACCDESRKPKSDDTRCDHVQPSSEVASHSTPLPPVILDVVLELPVVPTLPSFASGNKTDRLLCSTTRGSPPLHLLNSVLLI